MPPWKFWSPASRAALYIAVTVLGIVVLIGVQGVREDGLVAGLRSAAPGIAVIIALSSLVITTVGLLGNWNRQKRQATLEAWISWSDKSVPLRQAVTKHVGEKTWSSSQGLALASKKKIPKCAALPGSEDYAELGNAVVGILNGLERLAVGVSLGLYDIQMLRSLGGTVIVRNYERFESYIEGRQSKQVGDHQQSRAYTTLPLLVAELQRRSNRAEGKKLDVDVSRLRRLREGRD